MATCDEPTSGFAEDESESGSSEAEDLVKNGKLHTGVIILLQFTQTRIIWIFPQNLPISLSVSSRR